jgi:hypothetical protein
MGAPEIAMARRQIEIDRDKLRAAIRKLPNEYVFYKVGVKRAQADHADVDAFSPAFREELFAGDGTMVAYAEIFPFDEGFPCATDQVEWRVEDHHCVNPRCSCRQAVLSFLRVSRDSCSVTSWPSPALRSYRHAAQHRCRRSSLAESGLRHT